MLRFPRSVFSLIFLVANGVVGVRQRGPGMTRVTATTNLPQVEGLCSHGQ